MRGSVPWAVAIALGAVVVIPAPSTSTGGDAASDPGAPGSFAVVREEYDLGVTLLAASGSGTDGRADYLARLNGSVFYPRDGLGPFPLVLLVHGRFPTCIVADRPAWGELVCPDVDRLPGGATLRPLVRRDPMDNHVGMEYLAAPLASHGFVVASVNANDVSDHDESGDRGATARAQLLLRTIDRFLLLADALVLPAHAPMPPLGLPAASTSVKPLADLAGRIDATRLGLLGHSRGGEAVTRAISLDAAGFDGRVRGLDGVVAIAPTDGSGALPANVPWAAVLPYCDGDVVDLAGARVFDEARFVVESRPASRTLVLAMGANHGAYSSTWPMDDASFTYADDPYCRPAAPTRLAAEDQRRQAIAFSNAFFRHHLAGEDEFAPFLNGVADPPAGACPRDGRACPDLLRVSYQAPAPDRLVVEATQSIAALTRNALGGASSLSGFAIVYTCGPSTCPAPVVGRGPFVWLHWKKPATFTTELPAAVGDVRDYDALTFRAAAAPDASGGRVDFRVALRDAAGATASVAIGSVGDALVPPPGTSAAKSVMTEVRVPLDRFAGVDRSAVRAITFVFGDLTPTATIGFTDLAFQRDEL